MGEWFTPKDSSFLNKYDIAIFMLFQDGSVRNVTQDGVAMIGINPADSTNGYLEVSYGAVALDHDASDGAWHASDRVDFGAETLSLIYDGIADGNIDVTWWIADMASMEQKNGGSGSCNTVTLPFAALLLVPALRVRKKHR